TPFPPQSAESSSLLPAVLHELRRKIPTLPVRKRSSAPRFRLPDSLPAFPGNPDVRLQCRKAFFPAPVPLSAEETPLRNRPETLSQTVLFSLLSQTGSAPSAR